MRIHGLRVENIKRIEMVDITFEGGVTQITGKNEQGKSSVLDAIWMALGGKAAQPTMPVRIGARRASIKLDLGDLQVERSWSPKGSQVLTVTGSDGASISSPQQVLDRLVPKLAFDPLAFARAKPADQVNMLKQALDIDDTEIAKTIESLMTQRRDLGRDRDGIQRWIDSNERPDMTIKPVNVDALLKEQDEATKAEAERRDLDAHHKQCVQKIADRESEIVRLQKQIESLQEQNANAKASLQDMEARIKSLPGTRGLDEIRAELGSAYDTNTKVRVAREYAEQERKLQDMDKRHQELTDQIEDARKQRLDLIASKPLSIEGVTFDDGAVLIKGVPLEQASTRQQVLLSAEIGMAMKPELRLMFIREGGLLDSTAYEVLDRLAADNDFQILVERVTDGEPIGIVIEDGRVKSATPENAPDPEAVQAEG